MKPCVHWEEVGRCDGGRCRIKHRTEYPSFGTCLACPVATLENRDWFASRLKQDPPPPSEWDMIRDFSSAMVRWVKLGCAVVTEDVFEGRRAACSACEHWDAGARLGLGKCAKCGCSRLKWHLPSEACPIGVW